MNQWLRRSVQGSFALLVFSCALTAALIVNQGLLGFLIPAPRDAEPLARVPLSSLPFAGLDTARLARLTGLSLPTPGPGVQDLEPGGPSIPRSTLAIRLLGTLVAQDPQWSMASIHELTGGGARSLMVSDAFQGARVFAIERERILLVVDGRLEYVDGSPLSGAAPVAVKVHPGAATPGGSGLGRGIRATGEHTYAVPRDDVAEALTNLNQVLTEARVVPALRDGRPVGFKLLSVREGSLYTRLGLRNGDVLQRINGLDLEDMEKALQAFTQLRDARRIELQLERGGAPVRKVFDVE
ncbi:type II secretion system protein GspC [Corallococcus llansteffanensis]|uniref:General secretion pathway protein GspC n=1 Tax=Corallococcus llansteffanensis TaxID=2316731 RepID=A0A3A8P6D4_9BACT|nr:type II secretion system protein GspC [Corallococcus llansteffanensis]RKH50980.1 general secretion pathway protein GspC [Corallococcus llansteffanensis]